MLIVYSINVDNMFACFTLLGDGLCNNKYFIRRCTHFLSCSLVRMKTENEVTDMN